MKKNLFLTICMLIFGFWAVSQNAWINELHYDNGGADANEVIEIVIENPGVYTLSDFSVYLYNGNDGAKYSNESVDNFTEGNIEGNYTIYYWLESGIQNGAPDGLALVYSGAVISGQFLSYEGTFEATDGPANGMTSVDIGVYEDDDTQDTESLQLSGMGTQYSDFTWQAPATSTVGSLNNSQTFVSGGVNNPTNFIATTVSNSQINLGWTQNGNSDNVMVAWSSDGVFGTPSGSYNVEDPITGGGTVLYNASGTSTSHTSLSSGTQYYYMAWSVDGSNIYSNGVSDDATTLSQMLPDNWSGDTDIEIYQESTDPHGGTYCAKVVVVGTGGTGNTECDFGNLTSLSVTAGNTYTVSFWYKTSAHVIGVARFIWVGASASGSWDYTIAGATNWTECTSSSNVPSGATAISSIEIRFFDQTGFSSPETQYIDDLTFESPTGTSITVINGDLESWPASSSPVITNIAHTPQLTTSSESVSVSADVTDDGSITDVDLNWGTTSGNLTNPINMSNTGGDTYTTDSDIPAQTHGTTVYFEIVAQDNDGGTTTSPEQSYIVTNIVINEIFADPDATNGDANGDGVVNTHQDEFVELLNNSSSPIDISGFIIADAVADRHLFPSGTILQPNDAVVVFGGGSPTGFDYFDVQTASTGYLYLNNSGDDVNIKNKDGVTVVTYTYGSEGGDNQSLTRDPDFTGSFVKHSVATGSGGSLFSPNKFIDGSWFKPVTAWDGDQADNNWDNADNWSNGVPTTDSRVAIPGSLTDYPTLSSGGSVCNSLFLESDASFIGAQHLTINGTAVLERQIDAWVTNDDGWHLFSSPISSFTIAGSDFVPTSGSDDLYMWDELNNKWYNYLGGNFSDTEFEVGKGYLAAYASTSTKLFYGDINTSSSTKNLTYTSGEGEGWNLFGNPYSSAIDWDLITKSENVNGAVYALVDAQYISWNGSTGGLTNGHIPVNNGFFVKTDQGGQSITMEVGDQVHSSQGFLKNTAELVDNTLKVTISNDTYESNTYIQFREEATVEFDNKIDAYKLFGTTSGPQLYTKYNEILYSINCLPFSSEVFELKMSFKNEMNGTYNITNIGQNSFSDDFILFLEDLVSGETIELLEQTVYSFSADIEDDENRFILHFHGVTSVGEPPAIKDALIYSHDKTVYIKLNQLPKNNTRVEMFNILGQQVAAGDMSPTSLMQLRLDEKPGIYIVRLRTENGLITQKVMIK